MTLPAGLTVLKACFMVAAPGATKILGALGAEINTSSRPPATSADAPCRSARSATRSNRTTGGKRSVGLDLKPNGGRSGFHESSWSQTSSWNLRSDDVRIIDLVAPDAVGVKEV